MKQFFIDAGVDQNAVAKLGSIDHINVPILRRRCRAYDGLERCLYPHKSSCDTSRRRLFEALENLYGFICNEAFDDHITYMQCLQRPSVAVRIHQCGKTYERLTKSLAYSANSAQQLKSETCTYTKEALSCVKTVAHDTCGGGAAHHLHTANLQMLRPIAEDLECDLEEKFPKWIIVVLVLLCLVIIAVCLACYCRTRRKREHYYRPEMV